MIQSLTDPLNSKPVLIHNLESPVPRAHSQFNLPLKLSPSRFLEESAGCLLQAEGGRVWWARSPCFVASPQNTSCLSDPREGLEKEAAGHRAEGIRKVLLHSPVLEWFYLLEASRPLWDLHMGSSETFNLDLSPALPFTGMNCLLPGVTYFLHCP